MADPTEDRPSPQLAEAAADGPITGAGATKPEPQADTSSLDDLLAEFDATSKPAEPQPKPPEASQAPTLDPDAAMADFEAWQKQQLLEGQVRGLSAEVGHARRFIDQLHFNGVVSAIEKRLSDFDLIVPEGYVKNALMAASYNPDIAQAFDNRGENPRAYTKVMRKLQDLIIQNAKSMPDREATEDRLAVAAAVRGATAKSISEKPADYGSMNDAEFAKELSKHGL